MRSILSNILDSLHRSDQKARVKRQRRDRRTGSAEVLETRALLAFAAGNLVISRVGTGAAATTNASTAVDLVEYTTAGAATGFSVAVPAASVRNADDGLTDSGSATSNGHLNLSVDGNYLSLIGYAEPVATASINGIASVDRNVARVDNAGTVQIRASLTDAFPGNNPRAAASTDGNTYWVSGNPGVRYIADTSSTPSTSTSIVSTGSTRAMVLSKDASNNTFLFQTTQTAASFFPTSLPTTTTAPTSLGATLTDAGTLIALDRSPSVNAPGLGGLDTIYIADGSSTGATATAILRKLEWDGSAWVARGTATMAASGSKLFGLTGRVQGGNVELYATTLLNIAGGNQLATITDTSGFGGTLAGSLTVLATAPANRPFRGVAFAPAAPVSQSLVVSATSVSVNEGSTNTFTVNLSAAPASDVTVTVARASGDTDLSVSSGATLTFTSLNWNTPQTVTLAAAEDANAVNSTATITVSSSGLTSVDVTATEGDNDAPLLGSIEGINFDEDAGNGGFLHIPPDPHGAVGPGHVVTVVNTSIEWHTKAGVQQNSQSLASFFASLSPLTGTFDPKVVYDDINDRFIVLSLEKTTSPSNTSRILLAVSDDADPNGSWSFQAIDSRISISGVDSWADYPGLAVDEEAIYITNNMFSFSGNVFQASRLWIVGKTGLYAGGTSTVTVHDPSTLSGQPGQSFTLQPAQMLTAAPGSTGTFLVSSSWASGNNELIAVIRVDNPLTAPTFSSQFVNVGDLQANFAAVPDAPQSGGAALIDTGDSRIFNAVWRNNGLYFANTIVPASGPDANTATAHWYKLDTTSLASITVADQGNVGSEDLGAGTYTYYPTVAINSAGDMAVGFAASNTSIFAGSYYTGRRAADPAGTVQSTGTVAAGEAYYVRTFGGSRNRWGDYSATVMDPVDGSFWTFNEYAGTQGTLLGGEDGRWKTRWGHFTLSATSPTISIDDVTLTEGNSGTLNATFTVTLSAVSSQTVTIDFTTANGTAVQPGDYTLNSGTLTFDPGQTSKMITVAVQGDFLDETNETYFVNLMNPGNAALADSQGLGTITDNDTQALVVSATSVSVNEGGTNTFTVKLAAQPTSDVTVSVARASGDTDLSVSVGGTLTFTSANWDTAQTVTLAAAEDADTASGSAVFDVTSGGLATVGVTATETDNDSQNLVVSATSVSVTEGATNTFTVKLSSQPGSDVTVSVARASGDTDLSVSSGATLTFTSSNWDTVQTVTLAAAQDVDLANGSAVFDVTSSGLTTVSLTATEADNDTQALVVSSASVSVTEGATNTFSVKLAFQPASDVTVSVARASGDTDLSVSSGGSLTFNSSNWDTAQTVTLAAAQDVDLANGSAVFDVTSSGLSTVNVTATEADNDTQGLVVSSTSVSVNEGSTNTFTVKLAFQPASDVTVSVAYASGDTDLSVSSGASLTFNSANWDTAQTVTLAAAQDVDLANGSAVFDVTSGGLTTVNVTATEADNDTQSLVVSSTSVSVPEGSTNTFTVRLAFQPASDVTVSVAYASGDGDLTVSSGASLTFTSSDWNTVQTVTLAATEDTDSLNGSAVFDVSSAGVTTVNVTATEADNDPATTLAAGDLAFSAFQADNTGGEYAGDAFAFLLLVPVKAGTTVFFTDNGYRTDSSTFRTNENVVRWVAQSDLPAGTKKRFLAPGGTGAASSAEWTGITPTSGAPLATAALGLAGGGDNIAALQSPIFGGIDALTGTAIAQITFGSATFPATFTAASGNATTALAPGLTDGVNAISLAGTDDGKYDDAAVGSVEIGPKAVVAASLNNDLYWLTSGTPFTPGNTTASFTIQDDLFINEVVFNPLNSNDTGEEYIELRGTPNAFVPADVYLVLLDGDSDDTAGTLDHIFYIGGMQFGSAGFLVLRQAGSTFTVAPGATDVLATGTGWGTVFSSRTTDIENGSVSVLIIQSFTAPVAGTDVDSNNDGVLDDGGAVWTIRDAIGNIDGGAADTGYGLLNTSGNGNGSVPAGSTFINLSGYHPDYMARNGNSTLYALTDDALTGWVVGELAGPMPNFSLATGGFTKPAIYEGRPLNHIGAINNFDVAQSLVVSSTSVSVNEGSTNTFTVKLAAQPESDVTVSVARASGDTDLSVSSGASLTFNSTNWNTAQTVTLAAAEDVDLVNGSAVFDVTSSGLTTVSVTGTEADNDTQGLVVSPTSVSVTEGSTNTFTVKLAFQPAGDVTVSVARASGDTDLSVSSGASLTFNSTNWNTAQTVTLVAAEDVDLANGSAVFDVTSSGLTTMSVTGTEADNDTQSLVVSPTSVSVTEGLTNTFTVKLAFQPAGDVTVSVARASGDTDLTVSNGASLTFTSVNWNTAQTVTLAAAEDVDLTNGSAVFDVTSSGLTTVSVTGTEADNDTGNQPPTFVTLTPSSASLAENASTASATVVSTISVTDDGQGTNVLSLSGTDMASFEIVGNSLRLNAGVVLDFETKSSYSVTVNVDDATVGGAPDATATFTLNLTNVTELNAIDLQKGQTQRSFVRYLDILFDQGGTDLMNLISGNRLQLTKFELNGANGVVQALPTPAAVGSQIQLDFGIQGMGGNRNSNAADGYYEMALDMDGNGSFESKKYFHRLLGDVNGSGAVDAADKRQILLAQGATYSVENDANGDGSINVLDTSLVTRAFGRKLKDGLFRDE